MLRREKNAVKGSRVLIYRLGSLGDTVVALPAFHLIARSFPTSERRVLTNFNEDSKAAPLADVLSHTGLVHGYLRYPLRMRAPRALCHLRREIRRFRPDVLIYLAEPRGITKALRDWAFFRWCGIRRVVGVPCTPNLQRPQRLDERRFEYEGHRLLRCLADLGTVSLDGADAFDLKLTEQERSEARSVLEGIPASAPILAFSIGSKVAVKDWGDPNWLALLRRLGAHLSGWSLVAIGAAVERERTQHLVDAWGGPSLNLCGQLSVRASAAVLESARLFVGHDSGPMHLAAAVGTTCVAMFSSRDLPGVWFPWGSRHRILYSDVACRNCKLSVCTQYEQICIASIAIDAVVRQIRLALAA